MRAVLTSPVSPPRHIAPWPSRRLWCSHLGSQDPCLCLEHSKVTLSCAVVGHCAGCFWVVLGWVRLVQEHNRETKTEFISTGHQDCDLTSPGHRCLRLMTDAYPFWHTYMQTPILYIFILYLSIFLKHFLNDLLYWGFLTLNIVNIIDVLVLIAPI